MTYRAEGKSTEVGIIKTRKPGGAPQRRTLRKGNAHAALASPGLKEGPQGLGTQTGHQPAVLGALKKGAKKLVLHCWECWEHLRVQSELMQWQEAAFLG